mgnify:CR=1 FL=1
MIQLTKKLLINKKKGVQKGGDILIAHEFKVPIDKSKATNEKKYSLSIDVVATNEQGDPYVTNVLYNEWFDRKTALELVKREQKAKDNYYITLFDVNGNYVVWLGQEHEYYKKRKYPQSYTHLLKRD